MRSCRLFTWHGFLRVVSQDISTQRGAGWCDRYHGVEREESQRMNACYVTRWGDIAITALEAVYHVRCAKEVDPPPLQGREKGKQSERKDKGASAPGASRRGAGGKEGGGSYREIRASCRHSDDYRRRCGGIAALGACSNGLGAVCVESRGAPPPSDRSGGAVCTGLPEL